MSFRPCYSQSPLTNGFYYHPPLPPPSKSGLKLVCNVNIVYRYLKSLELSRLCPETSTKLYVHEFCFSILMYIQTRPICVHLYAEQTRELTWIQLGEEAHPPEAHQHTQQHPGPLLQQYVLHISTLNSTPVLSCNSMHYTSAHSTAPRSSPVTVCTTHQHTQQRPGPLL
jgi:hypothetical protein